MRAARRRADSVGRIASLEIDRAIERTVFPSANNPEPLEIAKIGALLQRFGNLSYDYRLFI
jgi:hypothetical protein